MRHIPPKALPGIVAAAMLALTTTALTGSEDSGVAAAAARQSRFYAVRYLVSDGFLPAEHTDPLLVNPWGLAFNPNGFSWVADAGSGYSTLYDGNGVKNPLNVTVAVPPAGTPPSSPTGIVYSGGNDFVVTDHGVSGPARFIFATEEGIIAAWAPAVDGTHALMVADRTSVEANYKGLAFGANGTGHYIYATDFHNNRIDVFDSTFKLAMLPGDFTNPKVPRGYAPFGIQNIFGNLYVTYAKQDDDAEDEVAGAGFGFVVVFDANGNFIRRMASRGTLNAPWGLALAPSDFGRFRNAVLVGNFGDGRINAFDARTDEFLGQLRNAADGKPFEVEGLWALQFGNGLLSQPVNTLFFTAGVDDEAHGLYGRLDGSDRAAP